MRLLDKSKNNMNSEQTQLIDTITGKLISEYHCLMIVELKRTRAL
jgi:hypothetical protein